MGVQLSFRSRAARIGVATLLAWATFGVPAAAAAPGPVGDEFGQHVEDAGIPGGVMARIDGGRVVETRAVGNVGPEGRFLWGSVSKPVTAAVTRDLAEQGRLDLSTPASQLVTGAPNVPVQDLVTHTAGLSFGADQLDLDRPGTSATTVAARHPVSGRAGSPYAYSSLGYLFLQAVVERSTGGPYEDALRRRFPGTTIGASAASCADVVQPHSFVGPWAAPTPPRYDGAGAGYGYTCGTIDDLAAVALDHLRRPQIERSVPTGSPGQSYGDGWRVTTEPDGRRTHWHTGTVPGYFSAAHLDPDTGDGVVVLMNASGHLHEERAAALTRAAFDRATGRPPADIPASASAIAYPGALLAGAVVALALALRRGRRRRWVTGAWLTATGLLTATILAFPSLSGYPHRYVWLWEPSLAVATLALLAALVTGVVASLRRVPLQAAPGDPPTTPGEMNAGEIASIRG